MRATAKPNACSHRQNPLPAAAWGIIADTIPLTPSLDFTPDIWSRRRFQGELVAIEGVLGPRHLHSRPLAEAAGVGMPRLSSSAAMLRREFDPSLLARRVLASATRLRAAVSVARSDPQRHDQRRNREVGGRSVDRGL